MNQSLFGIDNTLRNRPLFNTPQETQIRSAPMTTTYRPNQGTIVSFECDLGEMFGITLDYPGIKGALNSAFSASRQYVPVDTGILRESYRMKTWGDTMVQMYFDPTQIIGKKRKGRTVDEYYPQWVGSSGPNNRAWNWLTIVMSHFYDELIARVRGLMKQNAYKERKAQGRSVPEPTEAFKAMVAGLDKERKDIISERKKAKKEAAKKKKMELERKRFLLEYAAKRKEARK